VELSSAKKGSELLQALRLFGFSRSADFRSYLHLKGFIQVLGLRSLVASKQPSFTVKEFARGSEIFVNNSGTFLHFKFDGFDILVIAQILKDSVI
jgi:hypothetical protein